MGMRKHFTSRSDVTSKDHGFTVVELIVVILVIGIIAAIGVIGFGAWRNDIDRSTLKSDLNGVAGAMESARTFDNTYPASVPTSFTPSNGVTINGGSFAGGTKFCVTATKGNQVFFISPLNVPLPGTCPTVYYEVGASASYSGSGRLVKDLSGNGVYTLTMRDGLNDTAGGPSFVASEINGSLLFDGVNDKLYSDTQLDFGANMTWAACAKMSASVNGFNMFMGRYLPYFGFYNGNTIIFSNIISGTQRTLVAPLDENIMTNRWYCMSFTTVYDGVNTVMKIYLNGAQVATATHPGQQTNSASYRFTIGDGRHDLAAWYPFNGYVSDVAIYPRTLSDDEIRANFQELRARYRI